MRRTTLDPVLNLDSHGCEIHSSAVKRKAHFKRLCISNEGIDNCILYFVTPLLLETFKIIAVPAELCERRWFMVRNV